MYTANSRATTKKVVLSWKKKISEAQLVLYHEIPAHVLGKWYEC